MNKKQSADQKRLVLIGATTLLFSLSVVGFWLALPVKETVVGFTETECVRAGCGGEMCLQKNSFEKFPVMTVCQSSQRFQCERLAKCERQADGLCGFTSNAETISCRGKQLARERLYGIFR